jgi:hypothetical protein
MALSAVTGAYSVTHQPKPPALPKPEAPPQAPKGVDLTAIRRQVNNQALPSPTMLTGSGGVASSSLSLGKSTLLGQ